MVTQRIIEDVTEALTERGHTVEWPVTGKLLLDGETELDVDHILIETSSGDEAADEIERLIGS